MSYERVHLVVNPASGQDDPILRTVNRVFREAGVDWDLAITKGPGDATRQAQAALDVGADVVAVYGGDGTVAEVGSALVGTGVPLAILPGGTANILAAELGIPRNIAMACALACGMGSVPQALDVGLAGDRHFFVRAGMGFEAAMIEGADRETRERFGPLSYVVSGLRALREPQLAEYVLRLDGTTMSCEGMTCIVANAGALGQGGVRLAPGISVSDGFLDVIVMQAADIPSVLGAAAHMVMGMEFEPLLHWQVREVEVVATPAQTVQIDGELSGPASLAARILPGELTVLVPEGLV